MNWLVAEQLRRNALRRDAWSDYTIHRAEVSARILAAARSSTDRLCVLGAGNCDDVDLAALTSSYAELHLVDIDADALRRGLGRLPESYRHAVRLHGGIDLTGCWQQLGNRRRDEALTSAEIDGVIHCLAARQPPAVEQPFDVVASACILSQLIESAVLALGPTHPRLLEVVLALRNNHLNLIARLLAPGGRGLLITDFVSSDTLPSLRDHSEPAWPALLDEISTRGNFFHGLNPRNLLAAIRSDPTPASITSPRITGLWRWKQARRVYAVVAIEFQV